jgi:hypothetical protein
VPSLTDVAGEWMSLHPQNLSWKPSSQAQSLQATGVNKLREVHTIFCGPVAYSAQLPDEELLSSLAAENEKRKNAESNTSITLTQATLMLLEISAPKKACAVPV